MIFILFVLHAIFFLHSCGGIKVVWDKDVNTEEFPGDRSLTDIIWAPNRLFIFPGTKWCGAGNVAEDYFDLGEHAATDKCCRAHDYCSDIIEGLDTKYNLTNPFPFTRLSCKCDKEFYQCLKSVNTQTAQQVGSLYFDVLHTQCFKYTYPIVRCKRNTIVPPKCIEYELDEGKEPKYQWFDVPNFNTIL